MKKQYLFAGILIAALNFTACDEDYKQSPGRSVSTSTGFF